MDEVIRGTLDSAAPPDEEVVMSTEIVPPSDRTLVHSHDIELDPHGRAWIRDTQIKVVEVAVDHVFQGMAVPEIHRQYPHLSLSQIHAALAYYCAHQDALNDEIRRSAADFEELWRQRQESPGREKLRRMGLIP